MFSLISTGSSWLGQRVAELPWLQLVVVFACAYCAYCYFRPASAPMEERPLPPGPPGLPLIGNIHQLYWNAGKLLIDWHQRYGDVVHLRIFNQSWIVINSEAAMRDLICKRGILYANRPHLLLVGDLMDIDSSSVVMRPGDEKWRRMRRIAAAVLRPDVKQAGSDGMRRELHRIMRELLTASNQHGRHGVDLTPYINRLVMNNSLLATFGRSTVDAQDPLYLLSTKIMHQASNLVGYRSVLLDHWMWARYFQPHLYQEAVDIRQQSIVMYQELLDGVRAALKKGVEVPNCIARLALEQQAEAGFTDTEVLAFSGTLIAGGYETTASTLRWTLVRILHNPHIYRQLQEELDRVIGRERLPNADDLPKLRYVDAVVQESLRMHPGAIVGVPRSVTRDHTYRGYHIPAGTSVMVNIHRMNHCPATYTDPFEFRPERFLVPDNATDHDHTPQPMHTTFGAGRRVCAGQHFAEHELRIALATFLWAFEMRSAVDQDEQSVPVLLNYFEHGVTSPFNACQVCIQPRDAYVYELLGAVGNTA